MPCNSSWILLRLYGLFFDGPLVGINFLTISLSFFVLAFSYLSIKYRLDKKTILVCSLLFSLFGFYHNGHDYAVFLLILPFVIKMKYFKILYGYLLLFCLTPRVIRVIEVVTTQDIDVKGFMYNKYFVVFNVCILITFFVFLIIDDIISKKKEVGQLTGFTEVSSVGSGDRIK